VVQISAGLGFLTLQKHLDERLDQAHEREVRWALLISLVISQEFLQLLDTVFLLQVVFEGVVDLLHNH